MKFVAGFVWVAVSILVVCFLPQLSPLVVVWLALLATVLIFLPYRSNNRAPD